MDSFIGQIELVAFSFAPSGWMPCNGQILPINQYQALFALISNAYGGNGQNTFALPNLPPLTPNGPFYLICIQGALPQLEPSE
jgi:microcystin-dependent protein